MAIRIKQLGRLANEVIEEYLQAGTVPSVRSVLAGVYSRLGGHPAGTPLSEFTPIPYGAQSNPATLNPLTDKIEDDLTDLYNESIDQTNRLVRDFDFKNTLRERLAHRIVELSELAKVATLNQDQTFEEQFSSLKNIDTSQTDAFIDFREYAAYLPYASNRTKKEDLRTWQISYTSDGSSNQVVGTLDNIVSDLVNESFFTRISSTNQTCTLTITLQAPSTGFRATRLVLETQLGSSAVVGVSLGDFSLPPQVVDISRQAAWEFSPTTVGSITLTLTKSTADLVSGPTGFYDFGLRNVALYYEEYVGQASLVSDPVSFGGLVLGTISLDVDQFLPPNCAINWSFALDADSSPQFHDISPGRSIIFTTPNLLTNKRAFPSRTTFENRRVRVVTNDVTQGDPAGTDNGLRTVVVDIRGGRTPLFALCRVDPNADKVTVLKGRNSWKVSSYHYYTDVEGVDRNPPPTLLDFEHPRQSFAQGVPTVYVRYQPTEWDLIEQYPNLTDPLTQALRLPAIELPFNMLGDQVMHLFEANVVVNPDLSGTILAGLASTVVPLPVIFAKSGRGTSRASIHHNGKALPVQAVSTGGNLTYQAVIPLRPGQNLIQIVTNNYYSLGGQEFDVGSDIFSQVCAYGSGVKWYAEPGPQTQVSLFELQYQTARNDFTRFALTPDVVTQDQLIVMRELPQTVYDIYAYGVDQSNGPTSITMKATLMGASAQPQLTPKINSYKVTMNYATSAGPLLANSN